MTESTMESVESFRLRARAWLAENMPRQAGDEPPPLAEDDEPEWQRARELQQMLYAGGFAGICFPQEYGGLGLTLAHQQAFTEESDGYEMPLLLNTPTFSICAATLLDTGSEEQKRDRIGGAIRGEEILCQFLSEPSGGSDLAGLITRADRDGDNWILNGAKTWSTSAYAADWGLCLARTNWDVSKHRGLTMFLVPTKAPGVTMNRIRMVNGVREFCEEFFDDVVLPASAVVGEVDDGWTVASRQLFHERTAVGGGSPYVSGRGHPRTLPKVTPLDVVRASGRAGDPRVRELVGEYLALHRVHGQTVDRVTRAIGSGALSPAAASMLRLLHAEAGQLSDDVAFKVAGAGVATGAGAEQGMGGRAGVGYLMRQSGSLGGGSTEMSRNLISERLLGMPREAAPDRDVPFKQVKRGR
ncbi:acyl-CoA dehydrogenase [Actinomadura craniellae]|uniref:Acyl-CoA dehydrogenase n=1 Tax=Actinomadura craniellae TaxID=2231787 RepID=A0A365HCZ1_9ACTN|nr:acyl-CoA dehydrogenase family protein [Actinomadura craniellae]RAY17000.1 acyl-CoA dehydrogenase [Actinomadura craniellae]